MAAVSKFRLKLIAVAALIVTAVLGWHWWSDQQRFTSGQQTGLFTTLPILWAEADSIQGMLRGTAESHWARTALANGGGIVPLDVLAAPGQLGPLGGLQQLVIAQPRPLSPDENVALDRWVRQGGRVLLLADPALTEDSGFAIGDRRRPQSSVLLSPILKRWGLDLIFDDGQVMAARSVTFKDSAVPVILPGKFIASDPRACRVQAEGVIAVCTIGRGQVVAVADASVLERSDADGTRAAAFRALLSAAFNPR